MSEPNFELVVDELAGFQVDLIELTQLQFVDAAVLGHTSINRRGGREARAAGVVAGPRRLGHLNAVVDRSPQTVGEHDVRGSSLDASSASIGMPLSEKSCGVVRVVWPETIQFCSHSWSPLLLYVADYAKTKLGRGYLFLN